MLWQCSNSNTQQNFVQTKFKPSLFLMKEKVKILNYFLCHYNNIVIILKTHLGATGLGKSTMVNTLFKGRLSRISSTGTAAAIPKTVEVKSVSHGMSMMKYLYCWFWHSNLLLPLKIWKSENLNYMAGEFGLSIPQEVLIKYYIGFC